MMKSIKLLVLAVLIQVGVQAQLSAGDIAFIGYNTDNPDGFSFISLRDLDAGTVIYFTDEGWYNSTEQWAETGESHLAYTVGGGGLSCGSIVSISESSPDQFLVTGGGSVSLVLGGSWSLLGGDQVLAYQATTPKPSYTPVFISGIHGDDGQGGYDDPATKWSSASFVGFLDNQTSEVPTGLTNGVNCISVFGNVAEYDNAKFDGSISGDVNQARADINNRINWTENNTTPFSITASDYFVSLTCVPSCDEPDVPFVVTPVLPTCTGEEVTLRITGDLNNASAWYIYSGACGATLVGTTTTNEFTTTLTDSYNVFYVRGEDGAGCVDESTGACGSQLVSVDNQEEANFTYNSDTFCLNDNNPKATKLGDASGGFTAESGLVFKSTYTGEINLSASTPGVYNVKFKTSGNACWDEDTVSVTLHEVDTTVLSYDNFLEAKVAGLSYQWLDCNNGFAVIDNETNKVFEVTNSGSYAVEVFDGSCKDTSACYDVIIVGREALEHNLGAYPNPATSVVKLGSRAFKNLVLLNAAGVVIKTYQNTNVLDVSFLSDGIYFIQAIDGNDIVQGQFVKVK